MSLGYGRKERRPQAYFPDDTSLAGGRFKAGTAKPCRKALRLLGVYTFPSTLTTREARD